MKLFSLVASALGLAYAAEDVADVADMPDVADAGWQDASDADVRTWKSDVLHAQGTMKDIKNKQCKLPKGKSLQKLGNPKTVVKHFYRLKNGNTRATYQFKFADGTMVYAGNANVGQKGGNWKVYCYRQGHDIATRSPHQNDLSSSMTAKLKALFKSQDRDGSGTITSGGAYAALSKLYGPGSLPNFEETLDKETLRAAGKDRKVDLDEFECVAKKLYNIKKVYDEFKQYDKNHDLKMSRNELESALTKFYLKDVAAPGLIQTAVTRAKVKKLVDAIIKKHDKNHDAQVSFKEFETDAFAEEHYRANGKCKASATPLNKHEISVIDNLVKKFQKHGTKKQLSHSSWYQITSMLTEQAIDKMNGAVKPPALGCWHKKPQNGKGNQNGKGKGNQNGKGNHNGNQNGKGNGNQNGKGNHNGNQNGNHNPFGNGGNAGHYFGQNGGNNFGRGNNNNNNNNNGRNYPVAGGRVLLRRFLQQNNIFGNNNGGFGGNNNGRPQRQNGNNNGGFGGNNNGGRNHNGNNNGGRNHNGNNNGGFGGNNNGGRNHNGNNNNGGRNHNGNNNGGPGGNNNGGRNHNGNNNGGPGGNNHGNNNGKNHGNKGGNGPKDKQEKKEMMSLRQALAALHKQADENHDGSISDHEILDIFQGVRNHLSTSDFGSFMDMVNKIKGPVNCGVNKDCGKCTGVKNAGLCGWFGESRHRSPFGGFVGGGAGGNCKFVDRSRSAEQYDGADTAKPTTCSNQCKNNKNKNQHKKPQQQNQRFRAQE